MLEALEAPITLLFLQSGNTKEFIDGLLWVVHFHLLGIVVLVLDIDVAALILVIVLILEVVARPSISSSSDMADDRWLHTPPAQNPA